MLLERVDVTVTFSTKIGTCRNSSTAKLSHYKCHIPVERNVDRICRNRPSPPRNQHRFQSSWRNQCRSYDERHDPVYFAGDLSDAQGQFQSEFRANWPDYP